MKNITVLYPILFLSLAASLIGCSSGGDNTPLPKGQVPEWRQRNEKSANHPHDPNMPPGEK